MVPSVVGRLGHQKAVQQPDIRGNEASPRAPRIVYKRPGSRTRIHVVRMCAQGGWGAPGDAWGDTSGAISRVQQETEATRGAPECGLSESRHTGGTNEPGPLTRGLESLAGKLACLALRGSKRAKLPKGP